MTAMHFDAEGQQPPRLGLLILQFCIYILFLLFALRLWYLQVHKGDEYARLARENQLRQDLVYAPRGLLRDRHGKLLAVNEPAYALGLVREDCQDIKATLKKVSDWTGIEMAALEKKFDKGKRRVKPFEPLILVPDISFDLLARIEANTLFWPGLEIVIRPRRVYPNGRILSHILGFVAEANEEELEKDASLRLGDNVGKQGLEFVLEQRLRGHKGLMQAEVDATGRFLNEKVVRKPEAGTNLSLSIDLDLQTLAASQLEGQSGAVVVLDANSGQVLALVSEPGYDNNVFTGGISGPQWETLRDNPRHPLQNRAMQSVYPPGSVWKVFMAGAGLHDGAITPSDTEFCSGEKRLGRHVFRCWKKHGHGRIALKQAIAQSCDVYFYDLGEKLGVDKISDYAFKSGFGGKTGIDLPHEKGGLVPTRDWKMKRFGEGWQGGENLNLAIGQGFTLVSPLQVARFMAAIANGGRLLKPTLLVDDLVEEQARLPFTDAERQLLLDAMVETVQGNHGTARRLKSVDAQVGAKTGTAQVVKIAGEDRLDVNEMPYMHRDHAWLATWARKGDRAYSVVVMVEHGGHGGSAAGPMVQAIYKHIFGQAQ